MLSEVEFTKLKNSQNEEETNSGNFKILIILILTKKIASHIN